ncbi:MAG: WXG100 family type VII secretion target [Thermoflexales bacterium]|nr:WXG100 family type VII secretion target [Thermoflexales bacterium]
MGNNIVRSNHDELKTIASKFSSEAEAVNQMNQNLNSNIETLKGGDWIGQGAKAFYAEMDGQVMPSLKRLASALGEAAKVTNQISQTMQNAENEASGSLRMAH